LGARKCPHPLRGFANKTNAIDGIPDRVTIARDFILRTKGSIAERRARRIITIFPIAAAVAMQIGEALHRLNAHMYFAISWPSCRSGRSRGGTPRGSVGGDNGNPGSIS